MLSRVKLLAPKLVRTFFLWGVYITIRPVNEISFLILCSTGLRIKLHALITSVNDPLQYLCACGIWKISSIYGFGCISFILRNTTDAVVKNKTKTTTNSAPMGAAILLILEKNCGLVPDKQFITLKINIKYCYEIDTVIKK